jgi:hypothetical protein
VGVYRFVVGRIVDWGVGRYQRLGTDVITDDGDLELQSVVDATPQYKLLDGEILYIVGIVWTASRS